MAVRGWCAIDSNGKTESEGDGNKTESNVEGRFYLANPTSITRFTTPFDDHSDFD